MISPMPGASTSMAATVFSSSFEAHVERLDLLGVVHHHHRAADVLLGQPALVLGLQVHAPLHGELELLAALLQGGDRVGVGHPLEAGARRTSPRRAMQSLSIRSAKNFMSSCRSSSRACEDVLEEALGQVGVGRQIGEGDLRLDHPELGQVAAGVAVLGPEGGPEGVDLAHRQAVGLDVQLPADGQEGLLAEEVLREVDLARRRRGGRLARSSVLTRNISPAPSQSLAVMIGVWIQKNPFSWKKRWIAMAQAVPHAGDGAEGVGARPQVGHLAQVLQGVPLLLDRVGLGVVDPAHAPRPRWPASRPPGPCPGSAPARRWRPPRSRRSACSTSLW